MAPSYTGSWSPASLFIMVLIVFVGLCLSAAFVVMLVLGRFRTVPRPAQAGEDEADEPPDETPAEAGLPAVPKHAGALEKSPKGQAGPSKQKTGLWQILACIGAGIVSPIAFNLFENSYGRTVTIHADTIFQLALLTAQIVFIVQLVRRQKKL